MASIELYKRCPSCNPPGGPIPRSDDLLPACPNCAGKRFVHAGVTLRQFDAYLERAERAEAAAERLRDTVCELARRGGVLSMVERL